MPCLPPGDLPDPGIEPTSLTSPALAGGFFTPGVAWGALFTAYITDKASSQIDLGINIKCPPLSLVTVFDVKSIL